MDKSNVIDKIGRILTPLLVVILLVIVGKGIFDPIGSPISTELPNPFSNAFISAYQTGDVITGIFCAPIFIAAIASYGYKGQSSKKIAFAGTLIAGLGLLIVYGGLLFIGAAGSSLFPQDIESTTLVSEVVNLLLGSSGSIALSIAIALACLTSTIGVIAVIAEFLNKLSNNKVSYRVWALVICIVGTAIGSLGVEKIIDYALPIFLALYPVAIVLVFLGVFRKIIPNAGAYRGAILLTFIVSVLETLGAIGFNFKTIHLFISILPFSANGFSWLIPSIIGFAAGAFIHKAVGKKPFEEPVLKPLEFE